MDPLGGVSPVMEVLRRQMTENLEKLRRQGATPGSTAPFPRVAGRAPEPTLRQTLARRLKALDPNDPYHRDRANASFVEVVLLSEFGEGMMNDPGFRMLIRQVADTMTADPAIAADLDRLVAELSDDAA